VFGIIARCEQELCRAVVTNGIAGDKIGGQFLHDRADHHAEVGNFVM